MSLARFQLIRRVHRSWQPLHHPPNMSQSFSSSITAGNIKPHYASMYRSIVTSSHSITGVSSCSFKDVNLVLGYDTVRMMATAAQPAPAPSTEQPSATSVAKMPRGTRQVAMKVALLSPGFIYEPYKPREPISFWKRWFTISGWRRSKEDMILELKSAYAINKLRKSTGYTKKMFYQQAVSLYKEINTLMAVGDTSLLRKAVTERMFSTLKNELKRRDTMWSHVHWELVEPIVRIRTLRARMIAMDKDNLDKSFVQLTIEFLAKHKFEAYDSKGIVVSGDKTKEVLVRDIWVFERSLFHPGAYWRLCARLTP